MLNKTPWLFLFSSLLLIACASSSQAVQTASAKTQMEWTPIPTPTQKAFPSVVPSSTPDLVWQAQQAALLYSQDFESGTADGLYDFGQSNFTMRTDDNGNHVY